VRRSCEAELACRGKAAVLSAHVALGAHQDRVAICWGGGHRPGMAKALKPVATGLTDEDGVPEPAEVAVSCAGEIWCLGSHRIACGDSMDAATVKAVLDNVAPRIMVTDG
jgi:hypothetical protein